jgi:hypothetical protein
LVKPDLRADRIGAGGWNQGKETGKPIGRQSIDSARQQPENRSNTAHRRNVPLTAAAKARQRYGLC